MKALLTLLVNSGSLGSGVAKEQIWEVGLEGCSEEEGLVEWCCTWRMWALVARKAASRVETLLVREGLWVMLYVGEVGLQRPIW